MIAFARCGAFTYCGVYLNSAKLAPLWRHLYGRDYWRPPFIFDFQRGSDKDSLYKVSWNSYCRRGIFQMNLNGFSIFGRSWRWLYSPTSSLNTPIVIIFPFVYYHPFVNVYIFDVDGKAYEYTPNALLVCVIDGSTNR